MDVEKAALSPLKLKLITEVCRSWSSQNKKRKGTTTDELAIQMVKHEEYLTKLSIGIHMKDFLNQGLVVSTGHYKRYSVFGPTVEGAKFVDFECETHTVPEKSS